MIIREKISREYTFYSILQGIYHIAITNNFNDYEAYFKIPNNDKIFYDVIHRYPNSEDDIAYQYKDEIIDNQFVSKL